MPLGIGIFTVILDQLAKYFVTSCMQYGESLPLIQGVFHLTYILNPGAAFGIFEHRRWFFVVIALAIITAALVFYRRIQQSPLLVRIGTGLILGGAVGNTIDRIQTGLVIDFLDFRVWPVFNIADIGICVGAALLIIDVWQRRHDDDFCS